MANDIQVIEGDILSVRDQFLAVCVEPSIQFEREAGFAMQLLSANEYALRIAMQNRRSVINAVTNIAAIGISLNPAKKQAYLVPRDGKICLDISYMGLLDLAIDSGSIMWGQCELVYEQDVFEQLGFDKPPVHKRNPFSKDRGALVGAYTVVKTRDGDYLTCPMAIDEIYAIRDRSSAWKAWIEKKKRCPWVTDEGEMVKKTVIKRAYKLWPKTDRNRRLDEAVNYLNTEGGEGLDDIQQQTKDKDSTPKGASGRAACKAAMEALSLERQNIIADLAKHSERLFAEKGGPECLQRIEAENLTGEEELALWGHLPSNIRAWLKGAVVKRVLTDEEKSEAEDVVMFLSEGESGPSADAIRAFYELKKQARKFAWHLLESAPDIREILNSNNPLIEQFKKAA